MHGVNLDQLGHRDPAQYGTLTLPQLEERVAGYAAELQMRVSFYRTNHEGEFVEHLHGIRGQVEGVILNPGAWTHYSYAIRDALEIAGVPAVEVHLSDVDAREEFRRHSVISDLCIGRVKGKGVEGYREALQLLASR
jgi:3-dehydroquinate dehydratase-2